MSDSVKAYIFLVITTLGWSANAVAGKFSVGHIGPMTLTVSRWCLALAIIVAISVPQLKRDWPEIRRHWLLLLAFGAVGFTGFNSILYTSLKYTSAINVVIEQAAIPGLIFIGNYLLFRTRLGLGQMLGYAVTLAGVIVVACGGSLQTLLTLTFNFGDLLMLFACLAYAAYSVALRFKPPIHWKSLMAASAAGALLAAIPLAGWEYGSGGFIVPDMAGWVVVVFLGIVPSLVSQTLWVRGIELIGPNRAGVFINTIPVFGTLLSVIFLREALLPYHLVAMALVLIGIAIAERGRL